VRGGEEKEVEQEEEKRRRRRKRTVWSFDPAVVHPSYSNLP
jgi:hypothetical protein